MPLTQTKTTANPNNTVNNSNTFNPALIVQPVVPSTTPKPPNRKPIIQQFNANPTDVARKEDIITFKVLAFDEDGQPLRFVWSTTKGQLSATQGEVVSWKPQKFDGSFESGTATISVIADDNNGGIDSSSINIIIDSSGSAAVQTIKASAQDGLLLPQVKDIRIDQSEVALNIGEQKKLNASAILQDGSESKDVLWLSSDSTIITVSEEGEVKRHAQGDVAIVVKSLQDLSKQKLIRIVSVITSPVVLPSASPSPEIPGAFPQPTPVNLSTPVPISPTPVVPSPTPTPTSIPTPTPLPTPTPTPSPGSTPVPPTGVSASSVTSSSFTLNWAAVNGATSYNVYKGGILLFGNVSGTSQSVSGLSSSTSFSMQVSAVNTLGESVKSTSLTVLTQSGAASAISVSTLAGSGNWGTADGTGADAQFSSPESVAVDNSGNIYIADVGSSRIRKITSGGVVFTLAGSSRGFADGNGTSAMFDTPADIDVDINGNIYVADYRNHKIRKITPGGVVSTLAGSSQGYVDGPGASAKFYRPSGIAVDSNRNVYVTDFFNYRIRKITPEGIVTTLAGNGTDGYADGSGTSAAFKSLNDIAVDFSGNLYVTDDERIRKITQDGIVTTLAGSGISGYADGQGTLAQFNHPFDIAIDNIGNIYVADSSNNRIRKITSTGMVTTLAGKGTEGYTNGTASVSEFFFPLGVAVDNNGNLYVADQSNSLIRKITTSQ